MNKINFAKSRRPEFMEDVERVLAKNPWITQIVSVDLDGNRNNGSIREAVIHSEEIWEWVNANAEGKFVRVERSRSYGFELESDIVLFHLTWGKG
jgi:hypothetical protein